MIFTDEAMFQIHPNIRGEWTWRKPGERLLSRNVTPTVKHGKGSLMVWASLTYYGIGWSCSLPEGMDGATYLDILKDEVTKIAKFYYGGTKNAVYQHHGAGPHRDGRCLAFIKAHFSELLTWPAQSPDLNPMENFWADLKRRLHQAHPVVNNKEDLWKAVEKEIEATPKDFCKKLIESMPSRLNAVIKAHGGSTRY